MPAILVRDVAVVSIGSRMIRSWGGPLDEVPCGDSVLGADARRGVG